MLEQQISLWAGGPAVTLGDYFIAIRYLFCGFFLIWAALVLRWPRSPVLFGGTLLLSGFGLVALNVPLARAYGLAEHGWVLEELGLPMVSAATGSLSEGRLVDQPNPMPFWSLVVGLGSGLDPERLLALYHWIPLAALMLLGVATYVALDAFGVDRRAGALAAFFVLLLSSPRLSYLESESSLWTEAVWLRPRLGLALATTLIAFRWLALGRGSRDFLLGGAVLGISGWLEPRCLLFGVAGVAVWLVLQWRRGAPVGRGTLALLGGGIYLLWPASGSSAIGASEAVGTWYGFLQSLFALSLNQGAVFFLAVVAMAMLYRCGRPPQALLFSWLIVGYAFWVLGSVHPVAAVALDRAIVRSFLVVYLAAAAGWCAHELLTRLDEGWELRRVRKTYALGLAMLLVVSLPWTFPFWFNPSRMDAIYRESVEPVAPEYLAFGEWIREQTPGDAVFVAGPSYAPWIPALSGRRVLSNLGIPVSDAHERDLATQWIATSKDSAKIRTSVGRWGVKYLAWGRLDDEGPKADDLEFMEASPNFHLVHRQRRWVSVFELTP